MRAVARLEEAARFDRGKAELLLLSIFEWVEVEALGSPALLEGLCRLRGAVMKAAAVGGPSLLGLVCDPARGGDGTCVPPLITASIRYKSDVLRASLVPGYSVMQGPILTGHSHFLVICYR